jgi:Transposase DDE domain
VLGGIIYVLRPGALAAAARPGAGLWQRRDLLAAAARLAARRGVGGLAPSAAGLAGRRRPGRGVTGRDRQRECAGPTWGELVGAIPVDRGKPGSKYHLLIDATGVPLAVGLSAANTHDSQLLEQLVDAVPTVIGPRGRPGRPRKRPAKLHGDKGDDYPGCRQLLRRRGITPRIARRGVESTTRWVGTAGRSSGRWPGCWPTGA